MGPQKLAKIGARLGIGARARYWGQASTPSTGQVLGTGLYSFQASTPSTARYWGQASTPSGLYSFDGTGGQVSISRGGLCSRSAKKTVPVIAHTKKAREATPGPSGALLGLL